MRRRRTSESVIIVSGLVVAIASGVIAGSVAGARGERAQADPRVRRIADPATGQLSQVVFDADGDLRFDTTSHLKDGRLTQMDVDRNQDGVVDLKQYFDEAEKVTRTVVLDEQGQFVAALASSQAEESSRTALADANAAARAVSPAGQTLVSTAQAPVAQAAGGGSPLAGNLALLAAGAAVAATGAVFYNEKIDAGPVTICHVSPTRGGTTRAPGQTISVPQASVAAHLAHGDNLGSCSVSPIK